MKKIIWLTAFAFVLAGCAPQVAQLQQLPEEGSMLVFSLVTAGLTWVLLQLSAVLKVDLSGYANMLASALAPVLVALIESKLQLIPPIFDDIVLSVIHIIVLLAGSLLVFHFVQRKPAPSLKS